MNTPVCPRSRAASLALLSFFIFHSALFIGRAAAHTISGQVSSGDTGSNLHGASIEILVLNVRTISGEDGGFEFANVPAGEHTLVFNYSGMETIRKSVTVSAAAPAVVNVEMHAPVLRMDAFVVTGEREGNAASIVRQRAAESLRTVLASDALGNLPNDSIAEVITRMPGVVGIMDANGGLGLDGATVRGTAGNLNTLTIDGFAQASYEETGRGGDLRILFASMFEDIEIIKAQTPERRADSLGGTINLNSPSLFKMKQRRRTTYNLALRWAPPFYDPIPERAKRPIHPQFSFSHRHMFDVFGGRRNLAISFNAGYREVAVGVRTAYSTYRNNITTNEMTVAGKAVPDDVGVYYSRMRDFSNLMITKNFSLKTAYRISPHVEFNADFTYTDNSTPGLREMERIAEASQTLQYDPLTGLSTGGVIKPGYTNSYTEVEPNGTGSHSRVTLANSLISSMIRLRGVTTGAKIKYGRVEVDIAANYNHRHANAVSGKGYGRHNGSDFTYRVNGVGWIYDRGSSVLNQTLTQTAGPDWFDINNYGTLSGSIRDYTNYVEVYTVRGDLRWKIPATFPLTLKTGVWANRENRGVNRYNTKSYTYAGISSLSSLMDTSIDASFADEQNPWPFLSPTLIADDIFENPSNWQENIYTNTMNRLKSLRSLTEDVGAAYVQANMRIGPLSIVGGVRVERTETDVRGNVQAQTLSTTAERAADPAGAAMRDYGSARHNKGGYNDAFPSLHLVWNFTKNFQARASYSTGIGRPSPSQLYPAETVYEPSPTYPNGLVSYNDPSLKPQHARNWDLSLEYYFEPVGQLSVGGFYKQLSDFIYRDSRGTVPEGPDNGFGGLYAGYDLNYNTNGGDAWIKGLEISWQQDLSFLPGILRRLSVFANYTWMDTEGDYDNDGKNDTELVNFVPQSGNVGLTFRYKGLTARATANYTSDYYNTSSSNEVSRVFAEARTIINLNLSYMLPRSRLTLFADCANVTNVEQRWYLYKKNVDRPYRVTRSVPTITFGVRGSF